MCGRTFKRCWDLAKFWLDLNDIRRIAVIESDKVEHIQVINLVPVSKYKYSAGKITNLHYLQLCKQKLNLTEHGSLC